MDIVLGVSMTPSAVRMVLVEGENADGASLDHDAFEVASGGSPAMSGAAQQVVEAILGTLESAVEGGHRLTSVGVAWTDHAAAASLRKGLRRHRLHDVVLVSELHAASALAQAIGQAVGCQRTALLFIERDTATLAVVRTGDGAVVRVLSRRLDSVDTVAELQAMVTGLDAGAEPAQAVFMVGSGVDIALLEPHIATATTLPVHAPDDGDLALARGAALAAAATPRYEASTVGMVSDEDTAAGVTQMANAGYMAPLGYSAVPDDDDADLLAFDGPDFEADVEADLATQEPGRKPFLLVGSVMSTIFVAGVAALAISLAVVIRPAGDQRPDPGGNPVVSSVPAPVPAQAKDIAPPAPETIQAPVPVVQEAPRTVVVAPPAAPAPAPAAAPQAAPAPAAAPPAPAQDPQPVAAPPAPAPAPVAPAPIAPPAPVAPPIVVPVPIVLPPIFQAPVRTAPVPRAPRTPSTTAAPPTQTPATASAPASSTAPSQPSYPTSTPTVTTYPTAPSTSYPTASSQAPSAGSGSSGTAESGSGESATSPRSRGPLWPLWPFAG